MGISKRMWEDKMYAEARTAEWECPVCHTAHESEFEIPEVNFSSDSASDYHAEEIFEIECDNCGFKKEGVVTNGVGGLDFQITGPDGEAIHIEAPDPYYYEQDYEDWYWEPSDSPSDVYAVTMEGMRCLLQTNVPIEHDDQLLNRVVFAQIIAAVEAYLSDTLINIVKGNSGIQQSIYEKDTELNKKKFTAAEVLNDPLLPEKYLLGYFREKISFHNLPTANKFYKYALNQDFFVDDTHRNLLGRAIELRHDCVHRNGKTIDGLKQTCFTKDYVSSIADAADKLVTRVRHMEMALEFKDISDDTEPG